MTDKGGDEGSDGTGEDLLVGVDDLDSCGGVAAGAAGAAAAAGGRGGGGTRLGGVVGGGGGGWRWHEATAAASWHGVGPARYTAILPS